MWISTRPSCAATGGARRMRGRSRLLARSTSIAPRRVRARSAWTFNSARPTPSRRAPQRTGSGTMVLRTMGTASQYEYSSAEEVWADGHIAERVVRGLTGDRHIRTVLDAGCGNGNLTARFAAHGLQVCAFDASPSGIRHARDAYPGIHFEVASAYDDFRQLFGMTFDACVCVEVIEHLYD